MRLEKRISQLLPHDKCLHFIAGVLVFVLVHGLTGSSVVALLAALITGAVKEGYDYITGGDVSLQDAVATITGAMTVAAGAMDLRYIYAKSFHLVDISGCIGAKGETLLALPPIITMFH